MHRLIRGARIGALVLLTLLGAGNVACKKDGSGSPRIVLCRPGSGAPGGAATVFDASGGHALSTGGTGGLSGEIGLGMGFGGAGSIEVRESGSVDASFTPRSSFTPDLGPRPLIVTTDLSIPVVVAAPGLGSPYMLEGDRNLYVSDGDVDLGDEAPVTGLQVQAGATLTLGLNLPGAGSVTGGLAFSDDVVNDGTITVVDVDPDERGNIFLFADGSYIGSGGIETFGTSPGQSGGLILVEVLGDGYNSGDWLSYGADQTDGHGGNGGDIYFSTGSELEGRSGGMIENTGSMRSNGGAASGTMGFGRYAGDIVIAPHLTLCNSGDLEAIGGDGVDGGGRGGEVNLSGTYRGELRNTGDITTIGGDTLGGTGGGGGGITLEAWGGDLRSSGDMLAWGGDSSGEGGWGGLGGPVTFYVDSSDDELGVPAGDIWVSGHAISRGGDALAADGRGGDGSAIDVSIWNYVTKGTQAIHVLGIEGLYTEGGDGEDAGGDSERIYLDVAFQAGKARGSIDVEPPMSSSGGNADPAVIGSQGGDAGDIDLRAGTISYGTATAAGGTGETAGADGAITPETMAP